MNSRVEVSRSMKLATAAIAARAAAQRGHEVRVRQTADVEHQIGIDRQAVLEAEAEQRDHQLRRRAVARQRHEELPQLVDRHVGRVDDFVGQSRIGCIRCALVANPSVTDRSCASGCGRRVSLNRRTSASWLASRKMSTGFSRGIFRSRLNIFGNDDRNSLADVDDDRHLVDVAAGRSDSVASVGISVVGRLSTQK